MSNTIEHLKEKEHALVEREHQIVEKFSQERQTVFDRFPLMFTMLGTFGLVATFYGFEHMIDNIPFLAENPFLLLGVGIGSLILSGTLYKKLG